MGLKVAYMPDDVIEKDAQMLIADYERDRNVLVDAPVPIDDITEKHLKIGIEFNDTHRLFGVPRPAMGFDVDILGAIFFEEKRIVIDESLDPDENPRIEGRYRYTAAHEVGHWRLHRHLFTKNPEKTLLADDRALPSVICRSSQAKERIELQADVYASCLLMPKRLLLDRWYLHFGDKRARIFTPRKRIPFTVNDDIDPEFVEGVIKAMNEFDDERLNKWVQPFAKQFLVSPVAMRIRLEKVGLLLKKNPTHQQRART